MPLAFVQDSSAPKIPWVQEYFLELQPDARTRLCPSRSGHGVLRLVVVRVPSTGPTFVEKQWDMGTLSGIT